MFRLYSSKSEKNTPRAKPSRLKDSKSREVASTKTTGVDTSDIKSRLQTTQNSGDLNLASSKTAIFTGLNNSMDDINESQPKNCNLLNHGQARLSEIKGEHFLKNTMFQDFDKKRYPRLPLDSRPATVSFASTTSSWSSRTTTR